MAANSYPNTNVQKIPIHQLIEYSFREVGIYAELQTSQYVNAGKTALQLTLQELSNKGHLLWQYKYQLFGSRAGQKQLSLPEGSIDIIEANYRYQQVATPTQVLPLNNVSALNAFSGNLNGVATSTLADNYIGADYGVSGFRLTHVGINAYSSSTPVNYSLVLEYSSDAVTWTTQQVLSATALADKDWQYWEIDGTSLAQRYWRLRSSSASTVFLLRQIVFGTVLQDIPLYRLNKDDYFNLPNRAFLGDRALQYWFDRQAVNPVLNLWPVPRDDFQMFQLLVEVQMPDVNLLSDNIVLPNRWLNAIQTRLSAKLSLQLPEAKPERITMLHQLADNAYMLASAEEREKSPNYFRPAIRRYTR